MYFIPYIQSMLFITFISIQPNGGIRMSQYSYNVRRQKPKAEPDLDQIS